MRSVHASSAATRAPVRAATLTVLRTPQREATTTSVATSSTGGHKDSSDARELMDTEAKAASASFPSRGRHQGSSSRDAGKGRSGGGGRDRRWERGAHPRGGGGGDGGGPVLASKLMQSMRVASPCTYLTPSPSHVTSALFYGGEGRVPVLVTSQLASHISDTAPIEPASSTGAASSSASTTMPADPAVASPSRVLGRATIDGGHSRAASYWRSRQYEPYEHFLNRFIDRGVTDVQALLTHPDAPSPAEVLLQVLRHRLPSAVLMERALKSIVVSATIGSGSGTASFAQEHHDAGQASVALERVTELVRKDKRLAHVYQSPTIRVALIEALLAQRLTSQAATIAEETPVAWLTPSAWHQLVDAAAHGRLAHSTLLWKLLVEAPAPQSAASVRVHNAENETTTSVPLPSGELGYAAAHYAPSTGALGNAELASRAAPRERARVRLFDDLDSFSRFTDTLYGDQDAARPWRTEKEKKWLAMSFLLNAHGVVYGLSAQTTAQLLLRAGPGVHHQASSLLGLHVMHRYVRTCELLAQEASHLEATLTAQVNQIRQWHHMIHSSATVGAMTTTAPPADAPQTTAIAPVTANALTVLNAVFHSGRPSLAAAAAPHPSPYLAFFRIAREARDLLSLVIDEDAVAVAATTARGQTRGTDSANGRTSSASSASPPLAVVAGVTRRRAALPMLHWELVWRTFQQLNRDNPRWYTMLPPAEAADLCQDVIEVLCRGADPWLTLNVARAVSSKHIIDGLDMTLWLLHHLDASHHTQEAKEVTRKLYQWLLVDVGIHLHPALHHHLIPAARVLIRLGLHEDLKGFYNAVLDNVYAFSEAFRHDFTAAMADLACPACSSLLAEHDPYHDRTCANCMQHVPAKDPATLPSYQLSAEHIARQRERRLAQQRHRRQRSFESAHRLGRTRGAPAQDVAVALFNKEVLSDSARAASDDQAPLLPGVALASALPLFPLEGDDGAVAGQRGEHALDLRIAIEESYRRLDLQRQARAYALSHRGVTSGEAALPSSSYQLLSPLTPHQGGVPAYQYDPRHDRSASSPVPLRETDGPWVCVWCQEKNSEWASRLECTACGAETGPSAPWRIFTYATNGDAVAEIRARIANCDARPVEAVMAAYLLMVYRRAFSLAAAPHDHERIHHLVHRLCELQERVLAGFIYTRLVPPPQRRKDENLVLLSQLFEGSVEACQQLTEQDLLNDEKLFEAVFSKDTCRVCFGHHDWQVCPIITRDFSATSSAASSSSTARSRISLSPEEKQALVLNQLKKRIQIALEQGNERPKLVVDAYAAFITSPFREVFAEVHAEETNALSITLSRFKQYRRAAFVLCHIPPHARLNEAYLVLTHYFNVTDEEAMSMLSKRGPLGVPDISHPNITQVTQTCCMCLDERHASFACPRLKTWLREAHQLGAVMDASARVNESRSRSGSGGSATTASHGASHRRSSESSALVDPMHAYDLQRRLKAQADGWTSAGPERLHAFYRFLLDHVDDELREGYNAPMCGSEEDGGGSTTPLSVSGSSRPRRHVLREGPGRFDTPLVYAINKVIRKLASVGKDNEAYRLYAHTPASCVAIASTTALLRLQRFSDEHIRDLIGAHAGRDGSDADLTTADTPSASPSSSAASAPVLSLDSTNVATQSVSARTAAVPLRQRCLVCMDPLHSFLQCPELATQASIADRLLHVVRHVGGIACSTDGISAAAAYVYHTYNMGHLPHDLLRDHPPLVAALLTLCQRCFATEHVAAGVRVLRRLPIEMVPPLPIYAHLWRAAGLPEAEVESRTEAILALYDSEGIRPSLENPPPRPTFTTHMMSSLSRLTHDGLCRHCYQSGHTLATCSVFHAEVSFGRDYVAAYRMNMMSEQLSTEWQDDYLLTLVEFFDTHRLYMPYHISGVANALSAIAAMWSFRGEPGVALHHLLMIPPSYRRRQAFKHLLHCLQVPAAEISRLLDGVVFVPDDIGTRASSRGSTEATSLTASSSAAISGGGGASVAQHLLIPKPAIRDVAMRAVFENVPAAMAALAECDARVAYITARNRPQDTHASKTTSASAGASSGTRPRWGAKAVVPAVHVMQSGDIRRLREDFDPILSRLEEAVGMKLGSRHILFTSAVDVLAAATATSPSSPPSSSAGAAPSFDSSSRPTTDADMSVAESGAHAATREPTHTTRADAAPQSRGRPEDDEVRTDVAGASRDAGSAGSSRRPPEGRHSSPNDVRHRTPSPSSQPDGRSRGGRGNRRNANNTNNGNSSSGYRRSSRDSRRSGYHRRGDRAQQDRPA